MTSHDGTPPASGPLCELCGLPHRHAKGRCDDCGHPLGSEPNWEALRNELPGLRLRLLFGVVATVALVLLALSDEYQVAAYIFLTPPVLWAFLGVYRFRLLSRSLKGRRPTEPEAPGSTATSD